MTTTVGRNKKRGFVEEHIQDRSKKREADENMSRSKGKFSREEVYLLQL